jgi:hypothetical protein
MLNICPTLRLSNLFGGGSCPPCPPVPYAYGFACFKPVTDEQVFYDKFLCDKFYLPSARVYMQQILYDKFSYDKFYFLVWTCQQVYFDSSRINSKN